MDPTRAGRVRPARRPGMLRAHDDLRSHRGDRERPPARRRRSPAPHRAPLPGQARRRRRGPARHVRGVRHRRQPGRARAHGSGPAAGRPPRVAVAQLLGVRRRRLRDGQARRGAGAGQLHADRARGRLHPAPLGRAGDRRRGLAGPDGGEGAGRRRGGQRDPRLDRTVRRGGTRRLGRRRRLVAGRPRGGPGRAGGRRRPGAADVHLGHGVASEGRPALEPLADQPVRQLRDRRRDERGRRRGPRAADVPLRAAGLLLLRRRLPRRDQRDPSRARPCGAARDDRAGAGHEALLPADRVDLAAAPPRLRRDGPVVAAEGLLRRLADADRGAARAAAAAPGRRAVELLRADRDGAAGDHPAPARAAGTGRQRGQGGDQRRDPGRRRRRRAGPAGHDRRDRAPQPARGARLLRGRGEDRGGVRRWLVPLR